MQGVPVSAEAMYASGHASRLFDTSQISATAWRRLAGNSFSQPCMTAFISWTLAHLHPRQGAQKPGTLQEIIYHEPEETLSDTDDGECAA